MVGPTYTILTPEELARLRVDMYVGALSPPAASEQKKTLHVGTDGAIWGAAQRLADALEHIITEVVVNCADQISLGRSRRAELYIDRDTGLIRVWNDGRIPIEKHPQRPGLYNAEVIYGLMNSSSNYSDATKAKNNQFTGGRNGIGAKAANILSSRFVVSCTDAELGLDLVATWRNGMTIADGAVVKTTRPKRKTSSVCVEFIPDYARLGCELPLSDAAVSSLAMRFVECAATCVVRGARFVMDLPIISSNGVQLGEAIDVVVPCVASNKRALMSSSTMPRKRKKMAPTCAGGPSRDEEEDGDDNGVPVANPTRRTLECRPNFKKMATALMATDPSTVFHDIVGKTLFEVVVAMENDSSMGMYDFGYVNSVRCFSGTHIAYAKGCIANALLGEPNIKKALGPNTPTGAITRHFRVGVRCLIQNPSFSSQTKDKLVTPFSKFGFTWSVPPHIVKKLKDHVLEGAKAVQDAKDARAANKQIKGPSAPGGGRDFVNVPKLDDALLAPFPSKRGNCSLYITEGDSPKAFVMAGLSEIGRERNGVMPIRGKLRNVRDLTVKSIMACQEVVNVLKALGLTPGQNVTDLKQLRYQKFVILTDQDDDGHHIAGLLANMIDVVAPKLLERFPLFISRFVTPLVKATKQGAVKTFYDTQSFDAWSSRNPSGWTIRFLKGLGSSSTAEAKEYFRNIDQHMCPFTFASAAAHGALEIAFGKDVPGRKKWMMETSDAPPCDYVGQRPLPFETFCNTSLAAYSQSSLIRGIPSLVDGCCEASRKLIFGLEKLGVTKSERVSQLVGKLIGISAYHHGDASLTETLVRMAQTYVGGANVALLVPDGQFGSRIDEKKKHAAARYIATYLNPIVDSIFRPEDRALLTHNVDDGKQVEPHFFLPVTCYGLFNDTSGICTGWSTNIPAYNPRDVINYTRAVINGEEVSLPALTPWYRGYTGLTEAIGTDKWTLHSTMKRTGKGTIRVTELPPGYWTDPTIESLKERLKKMTDGSHPNTYVTNRGTSTSVDIEFKDPMPDIANIEEIEQKLGLANTISTSNMHLFDSGRSLKKYARPEDIIKEFVTVRMPFYTKRREHLISEAGDKRTALSNRAIIIDEIISGALRLSEGGQPRKEEAILAEATAIIGASAADFVMDIKLREQTAAEVTRLKKKIADIDERLRGLNATTPKAMWLRDLDDLDNALTVYEQGLLH